MAIPTQKEIQFEALLLLKDNEPKRLKEFVGQLAKVFDLTEEELNREYESGNGLIFRDRISWALSYLNMTGITTKPKRGLYQITDLGHKLSKDREELNKYVDQKYRQREIIPRKISGSGLDSKTRSENDSTPEELLYLSYEEIKNSIYQEILDTILSKTPREFEKLVVTLLQKMGYGGEVTDSAIVTPYTNDKGIDGIIKEDVLGFGTICIQAKKYSLDNPVGSDAVQKFVGALAQARSSKGVFITTSSFTSSAIRFVQDVSSNTKIVLIDGKKLANYIYDYSLGMQTERILEIKKLDGDFWDNLQDEIN